MSRRSRLLSSIAWSVVGVLSATGSAYAVITTTGQVDPSDTAAWSVSSAVSIGNNNDGGIWVDGGSEISSGATFVGNSKSITGELTVAGAGSTWTTGGYLYAGIGGIGRLNILDGAVLNTPGSYLGEAGGSSGIATVTGAGSTWINQGALRVGNHGEGVLYVQDEATVFVDGDTTLGAGLTGVGRIHFDNGTLHTRGLLADISQLEGAGTIYSRGIVSDLNLVFDGSHMNEQQLQLNSLPGQEITTLLDLGSGDSGVLGAGFRQAGMLTIADGSVVSSSRGILGSQVGSLGTAIISGTGSLWNNLGSLTLGSSGSGRLHVRDGATVNSAEAFLGSTKNSLGEATVAGLGSTFDTGFIQVGYYGAGMLRIENGAIVRSTAAVLGNAVGGTGSITLAGNGSELNSRDQIAVGAAGRGEMAIKDGAVVSCSQAFIGSTSGGTGEVSVAGPGSTWHAANFLYIGLAGAGSLSISDGATVEVGGDLDDGRVVLGRYSGHFLPPTEINLEDFGTLRLHGGRIDKLSGAATFNFNGGRLEGVGTYQVGAGLTQNGGVLAPGNSAGVTTISGFYDLADGALEIELLSAGDAAGVGFDQLVVNSGVTLGADSQLNLLLGYAASVGDSFLIVDSKNTSPISGAFAGGDALTAEYESLRYSFALDYTAGTGNDIALTVASVALVGDYNGDGLVDAADYTVWQDAVGTTVAAYAGADGNGDGVVDDGDHAVWAAHYGASLEAVMAQAVPEPAGVVLAVLALVAGGPRRVGSVRSAS